MYGYAIRLLDTSKTQYIEADWLEQWPAALPVCVVLRFCCTLPIKLTKPRSVNGTIVCPTHFDSSVYDNCDVDAAIGPAALPYCICDDTRADPTPVDCPQGWTPIDNQCFEGFRGATLASWGKARMECKMQGGPDAELAWAATQAQLTFMRKPHDNM